MEARPRSALQDIHAINHGRIINRQEFRPVSGSGVSQPNFPRIRFASCARGPLGRRDTKGKSPVVGEQLTTRLRRIYGPFARRGPRHTSRLSVSVFWRNESTRTRYSRERDVSNDRAWRGALQHDANDSLHECDTRRVSNFRGRSRAGVTEGYGPGGAGTGLKVATVGPGTGSVPGTGIGNLRRRRAPSGRVIKSVRPGPR